MIALLCTIIPQSLTADEAVKEALSLFPSRENTEYFSNLRGEKNDDGIKDSFFAVITLAKALKMLPLSINTQSVIFGKTDAGKPYFKNSQVCFSISHSKGRVVCAVSDGEKLGVDTECAEISDEKAKKLANRYFTKEEAELIERSPDKFKGLWCEKEAVTKFFGKELSIFLKKMRESEKNIFATEDGEIGENYTVHHFSWDKNPVILCSEHKNSTIIFKIQP